MAEQIYPKGLKIWPPHENAPDFVKGRISIHLATFQEWAQKNVDEKGYISLDLKEGREGIYASVNTYKKGSVPPARSSQAPRRDVDYPKDDINPDDIPF